MISSVRLQHFRSYDDSTFSFGSGVNIIVGPNAAGKTNLLEAVLVLARGSSYRVKDQDLVSFGGDWARLDAVVDDTRRTTKIVALPLPQKSYEIDGRAYKRLTINHSLPVVLFEPDHLRLLTGSPERRRSYLDDILEQTVANHSVMLRNYRRVLAQRNALLKRAYKPTNEELFPWNLRLSELGATIARRRAELAADINGRLAGVYQDISAVATETAIVYQAEFELEHYETAFLHKLEAGLATDILRGFTGHGPHREDFSVTFDGRPGEESASRGEVRTLVLALKVIELSILEQARAVRPLLLLDDVFSELDASRRHALTTQLQRYQTFITTTDADSLSRDITDATVLPLGG